jgi:signal transduction histidine kinase
LGFCGVGRDVTTPREQAWRLERQNQRLEEFANIVAHDLRSPLSVARGYLEIERERRDSAQLDHVDTALERMGRIIDEVLTAARDGASVETTTATTVETVVRAAWETVETDSGTLTVEPMGTIEADRSRLQRLFENLFRNSVEHGTTGRQTGADDALDDEAAGVAVHIGPLDDAQGFYVEDDGPGIPADDRRRVFSSGVSTSEMGTGFGLDIVRTLAEAHGWEVTLTAGETGGARFEFDGVQLDADTSERASVREL